ncbi:hypothetical protein AAMO2058_001211300, partial [Amorphochlora amoebiformis]
MALSPEDRAVVTRILRLADEVAQREGQSVCDFSHVVSAYREVMDDMGVRLEGEDIYFEFLYTINNTPGDNFWIKFTHAVNRDAARHTRCSHLPPSPINIHSPRPPCTTRPLQAFRIPAHGGKNTPDIINPPGRDHPNQNDDVNPGDLLIFRRRKPGAQAAPKDPQPQAYSVSDVGIGARGEGGGGVDDPSVVSPLGTPVAEPADGCSEAKADSYWRTRSILQALRRWIQRVKRLKFRRKNRVTDPDMAAALAYYTTRAPAMAIARWRSWARQSRDLRHQQHHHQRIAKLHLTNKYFKPWYALAQAHFETRLKAEELARDFRENKSAIYTGRSALRVWRQVLRAIAGEKRRCEEADQWREFGILLRHWKSWRNTFTTLRVGRSAEAKHKRGKVFSVWKAWRSELEKIGRVRRRAHVHFLWANGRRLFRFWLKRARIKAAVRRYIQKRIFLQWRQNCIDNKRIKRVILNHMLRLFHRRKDDVSVAEKAHRLATMRRALGRWRTTTLRFRAMHITAIQIVSARRHGLLRLAFSRWR